MKAPPPLHIQFNREKTVQKHDNTVISYIVCETFALDAEAKKHKKISAFYGGMNKRFIKWCNEEFKTYAEGVYASDPDRRKKYRYVPLELQYLSSAKRLDGNTLEVTLSVTLLKGRSVLSERKLRHLWNLKMGTLIPRAFTPRFPSS